MYRLQLPATSRFHPVFHASLLKKAVGNHAVQVDLHDSLAAESIPLFYLKCILAKHTILEGNRRVVQALVQWQGRTLNEATWEAVEHLRQ